MRTIFIGKKNLPLTILSRTSFHPFAHTNKSNRFFSFIWNEMNAHGKIPHANQFRYLTIFQAFSTIANQIENGLLLHIYAHMLIYDHLCAMLARLIWHFSHGLAFYIILGAHNNSNLVKTTMISVWNMENWCVPEVRWNRRSHEFDVWRKYHQYLSP